MSEKSDLAKLEVILDLIEDIDMIVERHKNVESALSDFEGKYALLMCIYKIGELLNKIKSENFKSLLPIKDAVGFGNIIVHNYGGVNLGLAEITITQKIPALKEIILDILDNKI